MPLACSVSPHSYGRFGYLASIVRPRVKVDASTIAVVNLVLGYRVVIYGFEFDSIGKAGRGH